MKDSTEKDGVKFADRGVGFLVEAMNGNQIFISDDVLLDMHNILKDRTSPDVD